jgi:hypothetical protein
VLSSGVFLVVLDKNVFEPRFLNFQVLHRKRCERQADLATLNFEESIPVV